MNMLLNALLRLMAFNFNWRPSRRRQLKGVDGWFDLSVGVRTRSGSVDLGVVFRDGKVRVEGAAPADADAVFVCNDESVIKDILKDSSMLMVYLLKNKMLIEGNMNHSLLFGYLLSLFAKSNGRDVEKSPAGRPAPQLIRDLANRRKRLLGAGSVDPGVKHLADPYLPEYELEDFPRLVRFLDIHFTTRPEICHERPKLITDWLRANGFEKRKDGTPWDPTLRQALAFKHLMENRAPIIRKNDLIAGTTTTREIGVVIYPDAQGATIWSELFSAPNRPINPYDVPGETRRILHHEVFPFWMDRTFREWVRNKYGNPLCQQLDERFAVYFMWKTVALSHTIADFPGLLAKGARGVIREIKEELARDEAADETKKNTLYGMIFCLKGLVAYSKNLSRRAAAEAAAETDPQRRAELERLAEICGKVPENPAETMDEAINAIWIGWVGLHMENTNAGLSLGRMDQWLQPFFEADMARLESEEERRAYVKHVIELVGCFFMRCTDHLPLVADIGNYLFGGSSSNQAITLGGATPGGGDAVNDMTYIFLKVTAMLSVRDPNVNARYHRGVNSDVYLKRLCEVNLITAATPSMHNDEAVMASLEEFHYDIRHLRDWSATGCVEPTLSGRHIGHTNCMMMNMVAALEMALNNGLHPVMNWRVGPETGRVENDDFKTFDDFYNAFLTQFSFLIDQSVEMNRMLGEAHAHIRPTPLLSSLIEGCIPRGRDVTRAGARYNSSGAACIGLADVTDSLMAIRTLVFEEGRFTLRRFKAALERNFENDPVL
ncbi:MAG: formate acetyltransferase, partial [Desulfobacterales bacterium]|nr:formate acetyltransferase [Desulfobacterales bacterium]